VRSLQARPRAQNARYGCRVRPGAAQNDTPAGSRTERNTGAGSGVHRNGASSAWDGVSHPSVCRGRPLSSAATESRTIGLGSSRQENPQEQRTQCGNARQRAEGGQTGGAPRPSVEQGREPRSGHDEELDDQRRPVRARPIRPDRDDVPDARGDQHREGHPGDAIEAPRYNPRRFGRESTQAGHEASERELTTDPHRRGQHVQEEPERRPTDRKHVVKTSDVPEKGPELRAARPSTFLRRVVRQRAR
jgi:hypothetical protein